MIQLNLTSDGLAAKTRNNNLIFTKFVTGSGADDNGESIHRSIMQVQHIL